MEPGNSYHMCVDIDAPAKDWVRWATHPDGRPVTHVEFERKRAELKAKGYVCFPPCDNVTADGRCAGHPARTRVDWIGPGGEVREARTVGAAVVIPSGLTVVSIETGPILRLVLLSSLRAHHAPVDAEAGR